MSAVESDRLCDIADTVLAECITRAKAGRSPSWPPGWLGEVIPPESLKGYTTTEIEAACRFLVRLGVMEIVQ